MEKINQNYEEQVNELQGYIEHFKKRMNDEMKKPNFEPNATQEYDGYDGVNTELNKNLAKMGINKSEIFRGPEQTKKLFDQCTHTKNIISFHKDQLSNALIGSTRKPYHDNSTGKLHEDLTKVLEVEDLLDSRLLAELLLKEREKLEKFLKVFSLIKNFRESYDSCIDITEISYMMSQFIQGFSLLHVFPLVNFLPKEKRQYFYDNILTDKEKKDNNIKNELDVRCYLSQDPIYASLTGSTPVVGMKKIIDDNRLARIFVEISEIN